MVGYVNPLGYRIHRLYEIYCTYIALFQSNYQCTLDLISSVCCDLQELEIALEDERRSGEEARNTAALLERKRIALSTELEDLRSLLEAVS